ncbi:uncharacterized protein LOC144629489 isoform X2 [Oculina patagonica]
MFVMARTLVLLVVSVVLWTAISADEVENKADDMAKAIEQQNKKVEEQSEAMEKAIDDKGKLVDDKEEEEKFEKASEKMDAVGDAAERNFDQKANLADKIADETNTAIENQSKKVEALGNEADVTEDRASKLVEKIGLTNQVADPTKRTSDMIEPSKVVVFPDSAVRGTDTRNMQIKEFHPKDGKGKWLAVHIPDRMTYPRKNVKIIASKKVADELHRVVGPNKDTLAKEIQTILGVDEETLQRMIAKGQQNDEMSKEGDDDDDDDSEEDDDDDDDNDNDNDNDDDENDEGESPGDEEFNDGKISEMCDSKSVEDKNDKLTDLLAIKNRHTKACKTLRKHKKKVQDGSGVDTGIDDEDEDDPKVHVEQPEGFELRWEDILNNFKHFNLKRRKKICRLFGLQSERCHKAKKRRHGFKRKLKHYLLRMLRKFLKNNRNEFQDYLSNKLKDALAGRLKPADDGLLHIYSKNSGNMNMEDFLKDLNDDLKPRLDANVPALPQSSTNQDPLTMDDNTVGGGVFQVTPQMNKLAENEGQEPPSDAVTALNNIIHPLLNDQDNKMDEKLQTKILQEELGHVNAEQQEQEREKAKDASINDRLMYMFQLQNLASHKPATPANGEIGGQPISVVNPHQVSLMQMDLPDKNPDIPLLGSRLSKPSVARAKTRKRVPFVRKPVLSVMKPVLPFRKRVLPFRIPRPRPRLVGTFRIKNPTLRPTMMRFWKRSYGINKKLTEKKVKYLRRMARKRSKRKSF